MAKQSQLRMQHEGMRLNEKSKSQELLLNVAVNRVSEELEKTYPNLRFDLVQQIHLQSIISRLKTLYPEIGFCEVFSNSTMRPDGGILSIVDKNDVKFPILISEKKNQGTNDLRKQEGLRRQARGNAIERLGKNVIGFRTYLLNEGIFPFVCFGDGCDFEENSSIIDRVKTIAMFGTLNELHLHNEGVFNRGTYYFKIEPWTKVEMFEKSLVIAKRSILYYFSKYGEEMFIRSNN